MSRVFVVHDTRLEREVVVKMLSPELAAGISAERFTREIKLAAALQHPHIAPVLSDGATADGLPFYSMPFVDGKSLRARLDGSRVPTEEAISILRDVAKALAYAHSRSIVHRDIKPENILLSSGTAVVTDFGIAKALLLSRTAATAHAGLTSTGMSIGTPGYMAPEQAAGDPATDHRADIYAWGVVAYELLAGQHPFASRKTPQQMLAAHMSEMPTALNATNGVVPHTLSALVMRALAKDPAARPDSAAELVGALGANVTSARNVFPHRVRNGVAIAVVVFGAATVFAWNQGKPEPAATAASVVTAGPLMMAVLPFEHEGPVEQQAFTNGLTDAVTAKLGTIQSLAVIDRRSAATYRSTIKTPKQIGAELRVRFLVDGVVRWAPDGRGAMRARVTPRLIDASTGTLKWTGAPVDVTLDDPFTAQGVIANDVAAQLEVVLLPSERAGLARPLSQNPQAFAAFQRGITRLDPILVGTSTVYRDLERASAEFEKAVALDSTFSEAWGLLSVARAMRSLNSPGDMPAAAQFRETLARALHHAPDQPLALLELGFLRLDIDHDTVGVDALIRRALTAAPNDAFAFTMATQLVEMRQGRDSAYVLANRAAALDPRSVPVLGQAAFYALSTRRWESATRHADALIALDSLNPTGWSYRVQVPLNQGDTVRAQGIMNRALAAIRQPTGDLAKLMAYSGNTLGRRFVASSMRALGIGAVYDSAVTYLDTKQDVYLRLADSVKAKVYSDSIVQLLGGRTFNGTREVELLSILAFAYSNIGRFDEARRALDRALAASRTYSSSGGVANWIFPDAVAGTYARLGDPAEAVRVLEQSYKDTPLGINANSYAINPKLIILHRYPAFQKFLLAHSE